MMRSLRHNTSKHDSRERREKEGRDYSDTEKDYGVKKGREESGGSRKESVSGEKRKMGLSLIDERDDFSGIVNVVDDDDEYGGSSSKKRKENVDDDRWLGGEDEGEAFKNKGDSRIKSSEREGQAGMDGRKRESKHHRSERKDKGEKKAGFEGERKGKGLANSERSVDGEGGITVKSEEDSAAKLLTGFDSRNDVQKSGYEKENEKRVRRKRESVGDDDLRQDGIHVDDLRTLTYETSKSGKHKDEIPTDKYREDVGKDNWNQDEKLPGGRSRTDYTVNRSDDKYQRNEIKELEVQQKNLKFHDVDSDREKISQNRQCESDDRGHDLDHDRRHGREHDGRDHERERDRDRGRHRERERDRGRGRDRDPERDRGGDRVRERDGDRDRDRERGRDRDYKLDRDRDRDYKLDRDRDRDRVYDHETEHDHRKGYERRELDRDQAKNDHRLERDHDHHRCTYDDGRDRGSGDRDFTSHLDSRSSSYKEDTRKRLSSEYHDDHRNVKSRSDKLDDYGKARRTSDNMNDYQEVKSRNAEVDEESSLQRKGPSDNMTGSNRGLPLPSSKPHIVVGKYRDATLEDRKQYHYERDEIVSDAHNESQRAKFNGSHPGDLVAERTPLRKVSPIGFKNHSPTSVDRRFVNRTGRRLSLDGDEVGRRSTGSLIVRNGSANEDGLHKDLSSKEYLQGESPFRHRSVHGNASSRIPGPPGFKAGADSPFLGSMGEENRGHTPSRYRRSVDPNISRAHGNQWKGVPTWPSPLPNGFMPFPSGPIGPPPVAFPGMMPPPFPSPPIFGLRPSMDMGLPGMPYISNADGFPMGPVRPLGWPNMVDAPGPPFHGWDANNGVLRDGSSMFGPGQFPNGGVRETNADMWKQYGDDNMIDPGRGSQNDENKLNASVTEASSKTESQGSRGENEYSEDLGKSVTLKVRFESSKEAPPALSNLAMEKSPETTAADNSANYICFYLSKLDISAELLELELYNQCMSMEAETQREYDDEAAPELSLLEENLIADSDASNPYTGIHLFPSVEDSIFQRALDLYNAQTNKCPPVMAQLKNLHTPPVLELETEKQSLVLDSRTEKQMHPSDQEAADPVVAGDSIAQLASTTHTELPETPPPTVELDNNLSMKSSGMEIQDSASQFPAPTVLDITDAEIIVSLPSPETAEMSHHQLHGEESSSHPVIPNTVENMSIVVKEEGGENTHCSLDQVGGKVSGLLFLHDKSVDDSEVVVKSESVVLTRIHLPAESTH